MITKIEESGQASYGLASFICDDENDIIELEEIAESVPAGSMALIINNGAVMIRRHVKNSDGKYWQEFTTDAKGGGWPADLPVPSAGGYGYTENGEQVESETIHKIDEKYLPESACWPSDLPKPSEGGYGYTTTEVTNEVELICEGPEDESYDDVSWSDHIECPEGLIIGEHYEVTVNGVTGTYECFDDDGYPTLGYKYNEMTESYEHGLWQIYIDASEDYSDIIAGMNLLPGETATFIVKVLNKVHHKVEPKYLPEGGVGWTERVNTVVFDNIEGDVFNSGDDIRTEFLPIDVDFESIYDKFINGANITVTVNGVMYTNTSAEKSGNYIDIYFWEEGSSADSPDAGNLHSSITDGWVIYDSWGTEIAPIGLATFGLSIEEEVVHKIDPKYLDTYDAVFICDRNILSDDPVFNLEYGDFQQVQNKLDNGITPKIKVAYNWDTSDDGGTAYATPVAITNIGYAITISVYIEYDGIGRIEWRDNGEIRY